jgi:hypothetical protein
LKPRTKRGRPASKSKVSYRHLAGFEAVVTPKMITLVSSNNVKPRTYEQRITSIRLLTEKRVEEVARGAFEETVTTEGNGAP